MIFDAFYQGYSNALESFAEEFHRRWIVQLQTMRIQAYLRRHADELASRSPRLEAMIVDGMGAVPADPEGGFDWLWCPEIGLLSLGRDPDGRHTATGRGAALAVHFACCGVAGEWWADLDPPSGLRFDRWWIDGVTNCRLRSDGETVELGFAAGGRDRMLKWRRHEAEWTLVGDEWTAAPECRWRGARILIMPIKRGQVGPDSDVIEPAPEMIRHIESALDLIERTSPAYTDWVARMLRFIVPWRPTAGVFRNASNPNCCSCVMMTIHADTARIAETFVHELSHHYFDVLESVSPLVNGRDNGEYWSPPRREMRPLRAILVAHHAFVNCLLYYQLQAAAGIRMTSDFGRTFVQLEQWREEMERHLSGSDGLTATGEMLWKQLAQRVDFIEKAAA